MYSMYTYIREINRTYEIKERVKGGRRRQITVTVLSPKAKVILQTTKTTRTDSPYKSHWPGPSLDKVQLPSSRSKQ